ncbi:DUF3307 domain-containing protein [Algirhabdus cladophorae]|uniref:DUF3307 domain-containing protein n=1 Tax=Algirhabdus cladophorae TaxID=3377108 RepID=UPI003B849E5A
MIETFTALLFAHALADFMFQTDWINRNKTRVTVLLLHGAIVLVLSLMAVGHLAAPAVLGLAAVHIAIDAVKTFGGFRNFTAFVIDQALHVVTIIIVAFFVSDLWQSGYWATQHTQIATLALPVMALAAGLILTLSAGQYAIGIMMQSHTVRLRGRGLRNGGRQIGLLERGLIFFFVLSSQPLAVGFLIAAKSILRFGTASQDQRTAEYVIIGTLASFGWAFVAATATVWWLGQLPPLEIFAPRP